MEANPNEVLTVCLQSKDGCFIISLLSTASTKELYDSASQEFPDSSIESLKGGFPPKLIPSRDDLKVSNYVLYPIRAEFLKKLQDPTKK